MGNYAAEIGLGKGPGVAGREEESGMKEATLRKRERKRRSEARGLGVKLSGVRSVRGRGQRTAGSQHQGRGAKRGKERNKRGQKGKRKKSRSPDLGEDHPHFNRKTQKKETSRHSTGKGEKNQEGAGGEKKGRPELKKKSVCKKRGKRGEKPSRDIRDVLRGMGVRGLRQELARNHLSNPTGGRSVKGRKNHRGKKRINPTAPKKKEKSNYHQLSPVFRGRVGRGGPEKSCLGRRND